MTGGCFKNFFATLGCVTVLVAVAIGAWVYRDQLLGVYRSFADVGDDSGGPVFADSVVGLPSEEALRQAERKEADIGRGSGVGYVRLTADEVAALVQHRLDPVAKQALDSLRVILSDDRLTLVGQMRLDVFGQDLLGPLRDLLGTRQPVRLAGPVTLHAPGRAAWQCDEFVIRAFPFPASVIPRLVNRMTGGTDGAFIIPVPETVGEIRVNADGVTLFRRVS
jgi:hypothetical protein